jgi:excisionase family DNA binding protein
MVNEELIGTQEAAQILGVDRATVTRWANEGALESQKLPGVTGAHVFTRTNVELLARNRRQVQATATA